MPPGLLCARQKLLRKRTGRVARETITSLKTRQPWRPLVRRLLPLRHAQRLRLPVLFLLHQPLVHRAAVAAQALFPAEVHLRARHQLPLPPHRTPRLRPLEEEAAGGRTNAISLENSRRRLRNLEPFFFWKKIMRPSLLWMFSGKNYPCITHNRAEIPGDIS